MNAPYDKRKSLINLEKHGVSFEEVELIDWSSANTAPDNRTDYGEPRFITYVIYKGRLHCLIWTWRDSALRPISFRKANAREREKYEKEKEAD